MYMVIDSKSRSVLANLVHTLGYRFFQHKAKGRTKKLAALDLQVKQAPKAQNPLPPGLGHNPSQQRISESLNSNVTSTKLDFGTSE